MWLQDNIPYKKLSFTEIITGGSGSGSNSTNPMCLIHGDFRLDNIVFDPLDSSKILAVLDWELSTVGESQSDLTYFCLGHYLPPAGFLSRVSLLGRNSSGQSSGQSSGRDSRSDSGRSSGSDSGGSGGGRDSGSVSGVSGSGSDSIPDGVPTVENIVEEYNISTLNKKKVVALTNITSHTDSNSGSGSGSGSGSDSIIGSTSSILGRNNSSGSKNGRDCVSGSVRVGSGSVSGASGSGSQSYSAEWIFFLALGIFRAASISSGVYARSLQGHHYCYYNYFLYYIIILLIIINIIIIIILLLIIIIVIIILLLLFLLLSVLSLLLLLLLFLSLLISLLLILLLPQVCTHVRYKEMRAEGAML